MPIEHGYENGGVTAHGLASDFEAGAEFSAEFDASAANEELRGSEREQIRRKHGHLIAPDNRQGDEAGQWPSGAGKECSVFSRNDAV